MSSNDLEGNTSALAETYAAVAGTARVRVLNHPPTFFHRVSKKKIATLDCELL